MKNNPNTSIEEWVKEIMKRRFNAKFYESHHWREINDHIEDELTKAIQANTKQVVEMVEKELLHILKVCDNGDCYHIGIARIIDDILTNLKTPK